MSKPLRTSGEILVHLEEAKAYTNSTAVAKLLANLRAPKRRLVIPNKGRQVYYALTNYKHWKNASDREWIAEITRLPEGVSNLSDHRKGGIKEAITRLIQEAPSEDE
jgi:hypothetical protein